MADDYRLPEFVILDDLVRDEPLLTQWPKSILATWWRRRRIGRPAPNLSRVKSQYRRRRR